MGIFKTREDHEREERQRHLQRLRDEEDRRLGRLDSRQYPCKVAGCDKVFPDVALLHLHLDVHNEEMRKALICNQLKCGKKFRSRKEYNDHVEEHKVESKRKIKNSIRAVLLYNKHGLLLEAFEREFKRLSGRGIPYKFLGYDSLYDLMSNSPDVVKVIQAAGGNILLVGVPDEKTIHVAKLVGNQRDSREGFNRKTADFVARLDPGTRMTISTLTGHKDRQVSDFVKGQIRQLLAMDLYLNGICLSDLPRAYDREFGYKIDCYQFGFTSIEDFVINGLKDVVDVDCDMFDMKIVEKGVLGITNFTKESREIPGKVVENIKQLMAIEEDGGDGGLNVFPGAKEPQESQTSSDILSLVAGNVARLLEGHKEGVSLEVLLRGYEGWHGSWTDILTELKLEKVEELLELCSHVCKLQRGTAGQVTVVPTTAEPPRSVPAEISANLQQMVGNFPGGVEIHQIAELYQESYGQVLSPASLGFDSIAEIVQSAGASLVTEGNRVRCRGEETRSARQVERLEAGWATVLSYSQHVMTCQQRRTRLQLTELEERMEQFYSSGSGRSVRPGTVMIGEMVAVLASDLAWRRGRVTRTDSDWLEVEQVDWGGLARLRPEAVRYLEPRFLTLSWQAVRVRCREVRLEVAEAVWERSVREGRARVRLTARDQAGLWTGQLRVKSG